MSKGRPSTVATHPDRDVIEAQLARKVPLRKIGARYGLSITALHRHRIAMQKNRPKIFAQLAAADWGCTPAELEKLKTETGEGWLKKLRAQGDKLIAAQDQAIEDDSLAVASSLAGRVHEVFQMLGKATDNLRDHSTSTVSHVHYSPEFVSFRSRVIHALRSFPEARAHLLSCLRDDAPPDAQDNAAMPALQAPREAVAA